MRFQKVVVRLARWMNTFALTLVASSLLGRWIGSSPRSPKGRRPMSAGPLWKNLTNTSSSAPPAMPGSQKIHRIPNSLKAALIRNRNATTPIPWNDQTTPMATPRRLLNHRVMPDTGNTVKMVEATPRITPKKR